ncbi:MAG: ABC transporter permease [Candidatus Eisenbacteria bacterium]|nr:ABC transporter permease [Candidatus Eisenbacteria bacterium]
MRKALLLAAREYRASVRTKGFIIGLVIAPLFMGGSLIAYFLLKDRVDTKDKAIAIVDRSGIVAAAVVEAAEYRNANEIHDKETGRKTRPAYLVEIIAPQSGDLPAQRLELSDRVRRGTLHAFLDIGPDVLHPGGDPEGSRIAYYAKNAAMDDVRGWLTWPINNHLRKVRLVEAGLDAEAVQELFYWSGVEALGLVSVDEATGDIRDAAKASELQALLIPIVMMMLMFLMVMMSVPGMLHSVMEEKTQKIAEVLLGSISPSEFILGKLLGGIAVSLTTSAVYAIGAAVAVKVTGLGGYVPYHALPWFFSYMVLAIVMMGSIALAMGATCSEAKDAQSLNFPSLIPFLLPMFIYFPVAKEPLSSFAVVTSLIPTFTPLLMLLRLATPEAIPWWQPAAGLVGVLATTALFVWAGGRIFRVAILMQGTPPRLSHIVRWAVKG